MPERRIPASPADGFDANAMLMLGEIRGQLRELIHTSNNLAQTVSAMGSRLAALEAESHQRKGANGLWMAFLKSPAIGWLIGVLGAVSAYLYGRAQ